MQKCKKNSGADMTTPACLTELGTHGLTRTRNIRIQPQHWMKSLTSFVLWCIVRTQKPNKPANCCFAHAPSDASVAWVRHSSISSLAEAYACLTGARAEMPPSYSCFIPPIAHCNLGMLSINDPPHVEHELGSTPTGRVDSCPKGIASSEKVEGCGP